MCHVQACIWLNGHLLALVGDLSLTFALGLLCLPSGLQGHQVLESYMRILLCYREIMLMVVGVGFHDHVWG